MMGNARFRRRAVLLAALALVPSVCAAFPKPRSESDTLFVVPVAFLDSRQVPESNMKFGYKLTLENTKTGERKYVTIDSDDPYEIVQHWDEGEYLLKEYSSIGFVENWTRPLQITQYLKLEKGKFAIFPCKIVILLMASSTTLYDSTIGVEFMELDKDDYARIREFLSAEEKNFALWKS